MTGTKATALERACADAGRAYTRFDYAGHGASSGRFADGTVGAWRDDAVAVIDAVTEGPLVIVGSSMGGWIMLLAALARPARIAGLVGVAAAPDFTERLMWARFDPATRAALVRDGAIRETSAYDPEPTPITYRLIEDGRRHCLLDRPIAIACPVRLLHGMRDPDVPWPLALDLAAALASADVRIELIKDGDHRLSRDADIALLCRTVLDLCDQVERAAIAASPSR
jgi:pimeloyl-ACP methyl ester carboxylesterase